MNYIKSIAVLAIALTVNVSFAQEHKKEHKKHKKEMHQKKEEMMQKKEELKAQKKELKDAREHLKSEHKSGKDAILGEHKEIMKNMTPEERKAYLEKHPELGAKLKAHNMDMKVHKKALKKEHIKYKNKKADDAQHRIETKKERLAYFQQRSKNAETRISGAKKRIAAQKEEGKITEEEYAEKLAKINNIEAKNKAHQTKMMAKKELLLQKEKDLIKINQ